MYGQTEMEKITKRVAEKKALELLKEDHCLLTSLLQVEEEKQRLQRNSRQPPKDSRFSGNPDEDTIQARKLVADLNKAHLIHQLSPDEVMLQLHAKCRGEALKWLKERSKRNRAEQETLLLRTLSDFQKEFTPADAPGIPYGNCFVDKKKKESLDDYLERAHGESYLFQIPTIPDTNHESRVYMAVGMRAAQHMFIMTMLTRQMGEEFVKMLDKEREHQPFPELAEFMQMTRDWEKKQTQSRRKQRQKKKKKIPTTIQTREKNENPEENQPERHQETLHPASDSEKDDENGATQSDTNSSAPGLETPEGGSEPEEKEEEEEEEELEGKKESLDSLVSELLDAQQDATLLNEGGADPEVDGSPQ